MSSASVALSGATSSASGYVSQQWNLAIPKATAADGDMRSLLTLETTNLPLLTWWIYLHPTYVNPATAATDTAQTGIEVTPFIRIGNETMVALSAPISLIVGIPITFSSRIAASAMALQIVTPASGSALVNHIRVIETASI